MNIVTIFAGREENIKVLSKYLKKALEMKIIDEVHFWNNTRNTSDEEYIKTISNVKRSSSANTGKYISINTPIINNSFELNVKASNDIHIKVTNKNLHEYEIVLGGWSNTKSVIRENNNEIYSLTQNGIADGNNYINYHFAIVHNVLNIKKNNVLILSKQIQNDFMIETIEFKTGHKSVGYLNYDLVDNNGFYFMDTCEKSWKNYYMHYTDKIYENDVIIKCDDDIVYIDLSRLPEFIDYVKNNDFDCVFANTINNGVAAYFQQNRYNLIPKELMDLEYPPNGFRGSLWINPRKAEILHNYFIENYEKFINNRHNEQIVIPTRYSINFFGYKGKNWKKISDCYEDDELHLTVTYVNNRNFKNILYSDCYVSHLSFGQQLWSGMNIADLINKYDKLYEKIHNSANLDSNKIEV